jgi:DNA-binding transcriptional ArsR family regulator
MSPRKKPSVTGPVGALTGPAGGSEPIPVVRSSDARAIRALAHPVRQSLLELLAHAGTLTATQASEILGESPANCAFHLRTLARYGFVEEAGGGRGRERPWRRVHSMISISHSGDPQSMAAASALWDELLPALMERAAATFSHTELWPEDWRKGVLGQSATIAYLTPDEARSISTEMRALTFRYFERTDNPELRPPNAIPVELLAFAYPLLHLLGVTAGASPEGEPS